MRKFTLALCLSFSLTGAFFAQASTPTPDSTGTNVAKLAEQAPIHWVSVVQLERSLVDRPPMAVGFDIDDTVLFSSPGFWRGKKMYSPDSEAYLRNPEFWEKMNNGWDEFSIPKEVARALIALHVKRGDSIYRSYSDGDGNRHQNPAGRFFDSGSEYEPGDFCWGERRSEQ